MKAQYANQNIITIRRNMPSAGDRFVAIKTDVISAAMVNLDGETAFKLFIYLCDNKNDFNLNFSPSHFCGFAGVSANSARTAFKQLIDKGYLIQKEDNRYEFNEEPQIDEEVLIQEESRKVKTNNGYRVMTYTEYYSALKDKYPESKINETWNKLEVVNCE